MTIKELIKSFEGKTKQEIIDICIKEKESQSEKRIREIKL